MSVINTNITSLIAQKNLGASQSSLSTAMERLSSGMRINSAKDDAAGQAIANRMTAQINGLAQAQRNANDGISIAQTAEGALNQINDNVQRIRELTVQAQNGTNSESDLKSIKDEISQRTAEIDRISKETNFNGVKVLASNQGINIQVGAKDGEFISVNLKKINSEELGLDSLDVENLPKGQSAASFSTTTSGNTYTGSSFAAGTATSNIQSTDSLVEVGSTSYKITENGEVYSLGTATVNSTGVVSFASATQVTDADIIDSVKPLAGIDDALNKIDSLRSELGAVQNRFQDAITNLSTNETNLSAARSRIEDADYAVEVANMTKAQILQQAGTSVLAQANQIPQSVLSLLG
ncbi:flagellin [Azotobacter salinestris]|uniref:flagellin N-terminal helical domain-containing protein n=1 Tax=Azotobacter salinestris TaxID=69964 RepID=UPI0032DEB1E7